MPEIVSTDPQEGSAVVYEAVTGLVHEPNFAVIEGRQQAHPEGKVVTPPRYVRPKSKTTVTTKAVRPRPKATTTESE